MTLISPSKPVQDPDLQAIRAALRAVIRPTDPDYPKLKTEIDSDEMLTRYLADKWLVKGKDVIRYHADSDSEDAASVGDSCDEFETMEEYEEMHKWREAMKNRRPITLGDEEYTARWVECQNCGVEFDVSCNEHEKDYNYEWPCSWHPGWKEIDQSAPHGEDWEVRGGYYENNSDTPEGFIWNCCSSYGDEGGCKHTKHKAPVNRILNRNVATTAKGMRFGGSKKRKVESITQ
ncbi:hypothetical protein LSUE1_G005615 [Lachnellula suecica]|uniref:Uncharacterized protein n=1 Tax=Lachnellula suecica TaxID=602035 RepID=A0A8T9C1I6_9HELO|nr:hypothetical protein LSUE1_G005615 [Lachnellula suecica]